MCARIKEPFNYNGEEEFRVKLMEWIGDVFYDILPEYGYEVREEQIYTAFQFADAFCNRTVHLAEAGLGTGKTFAYLLTAIAYARFSGKPVVIACATTALQEQLAGYEGDINTLSKLLDLKIDARMAKDPRQYICDFKVNDSRDELSSLSEEINQWMNKTKRGERSEIPTIPDRVWKWIGWDESMACDICTYRGFCKQVKAREHYRSTRDLIIVDHEVFFNDLWTRDECIANGKLPILPNYSAIIFDEGHKVLLPAAMQAGHQIDQEEIENMICSIEEIPDIRVSFALATTAMEHAFQEFFVNLRLNMMADGGSERLSLKITEDLLKSASIFKKKLDDLLLEFQIDQELYMDSLSTTQIQAYEGQIEKATIALGRFCRNKGTDIIPWVDKRDGSFWVVPRNLWEMIDKYLIKKELPVVFTSATLSNEGDFDYFMRTLGLKKASNSVVGSPFDLEKQVVVYLRESSKEMKNSYNQKIQSLVSLLNQNEGRALVLTNSVAEIQKIRTKLGEYKLPFDVLWEDKGDRGYLVRKFREEESSVLIGANFWEGIDVPGESLTLLIIWTLPFPSLDPFIEVQRKEAREQGLDSFTTVDCPEMGIKLKQGCGRLIRTQNDHGTIVVLDSIIGTLWEKVAIGALPFGARVEKLKNQSREKIDSDMKK
jgi:ATP-dependent DNA helicase DinG